MQNAVAILAQDTLHCLFYAECCYQHMSSALNILSLYSMSLIQFVGTQRFPKNCVSHIDASLSRQPSVKGERVVRDEVNAAML